MKNFGLKFGLAEMVFLATSAFSAGGFEKTLPPVGAKVTALEASRTHEFALVDNRAWRRPIGSTRWEQIEHQPQPGWLLGFQAFGDTVVMVQGGKASVSLDHGGSWIPMGMPTGEIKIGYSGPGGLVLTEYVGVGTNQHKVHFSQDLGATWREPVLIPEESVSAAVWKGGIYLSLSDHGVLRIDPTTGQTAPFQAGLPDSTHVKLRTDGISLLAHALEEFRVYRYSDSAARWEAVLDGPLKGRAALQIHDGKAFFWSFLEMGILLHHSSNGGATWSSLPLPGFANLLDILPKGEGYLVSTMDKGIFLLDGQFKVVGRQDEGFAPMIFHDLHVAGSRVFASGIVDGGSFQSADLGKNWTLIGRRNPEGYPMGEGLVSMGNATYLKSNDSLKNISEPGLGQPSFGVIPAWRSWFVDAGTKIYMHGDEFTSRTPRKSVLYVSVKGSGTWSPRMNFPVQVISSLAAEGEDVMAIFGGEAFISRDAGKTWFLMPLGPFQGIYKAVRFGGRWLVSTSSGFFTADIAAKTWSPFASFDGGTQIAAISGNRMVVSSGPGQAKYTEDAGATWVPLALPFQALGPLTFVLSDKVACVAHFDDAGVRFAETWCSEVESLPHPIRASAWKRLSAPTSWSKFSGSGMVFGTGAAGSTYNLQGGKIKP